MAFDPDKYLGTTKQDFDPNTYLKNFNPDEYLKTPAKDPNIITSEELSPEDLERWNMSIQKQQRRDTYSKLDPDWQKLSRPEVNP